MYASSSNTRELRRSEVTQAEARRQNLKQMKLPEARQTELHRETLQLLQALENRQTELHLLLQGILRSRIWRTMVGMGGVALGAKLTVERAFGALTRSFRRLWSRS